MIAPVTAIIPTRDRPELLRRALRSVEAQLPVNGLHAVCEAIVVFDQSPPDAALVSEVERVNVRLIENRRTPGLAGARNSGIEAATTDWLGWPMRRRYHYF